MSDIEIAKSVKLEKISNIAKEISINEDDIEEYGKYKCKISENVINSNKNNVSGKLILVTAISPTPLGEGKTTVSIAVADGLRKIGKKSILALREPSLGPVFGIKGGATGGGKVQIAPIEDINLHFTGDIHAITSANNLLSALIDNHIYFGNELEFDRVLWKRCMDLNDRQLRVVNTGLSEEKNIVHRLDKFDITVASEIMAVLCLAEDINLHFTGDIHAITSANNLLSALIDNHIYFGNELGFEKVLWKRCMDLNDRQLRVINTGLSEEKNIVPRLDKFDITVASEIMAILCLSENTQDLKQKLGNILIGYNKKDEPIYVKQLKAEGSLTVLLKDAIKPNLVQTLEKTPAIVHGGPFANIAHGCNSIIATKLCMKLADYTITEAGFGADLGAEKFVDIKCRKANLKPNAVVLVATIKAIKYHGGIEKGKLQEENVEGIEKGLDNIYRHIDNLKNKFGLNLIVAINKYSTDTDKEIEFLRSKLSQKGIDSSVVQGWAKGGEGAIDIANQLVELTNKQTNLKYIYELKDSIQDKIKKVAKSIYGAENVNFTEEAMEKISKIEKLGYGNLPICIAKTQYSFSDDPKNLKCEGKYIINVRDLEIKSGAGFIIVLAGKIMTMPGLPRVPAAESIDINSENEIVGIF